MSASVTVLSPERPRNRSIEARRAARQAKFERERLIVDFLNRGVSVAEIAARIGVTEKRMRALVHEILARRMPAAPEDFVALQVSRLNEALLIAYSAMSAENLRAVGLVVKIVRELDRYHGFAAGDRRASHDFRPVEAEAREPLALAGERRVTAPQEPERVSRRFPDAAPECEPAFVLASAEDADAPVAPAADRPKMAPQEPEKMEFAPEKGAVPDGLDAAAPARQGPPAPPERENAQSMSRDDAGAKSSDESFAAPAASSPRPARAPDAAPGDGPQTAPQEPEILESAPGNGASAVSAEARDGASPNEDAIASGRDAFPFALPPASRIELPPQAIETPEPAAATWTEFALDGHGGVRRLKVRALLNGVAVCAD